jgi:hypothetical protein
MNHMPALIDLVAACEHQRHVIERRRTFGEQAYQKNPFGILTDKFKEQTAEFESAVGAATRALELALDAVHAVVAPAATTETYSQCSGLACTRIERADRLTAGDTSWSNTVHGWLCADCRLYPPPIPKAPAHEG